MLASEKDTPGMAVLMAGKSKDGAKGEHTDKEEMSDEELHAAIDDANDAHRDAHGVGDLEGMREHGMTLHKLYATKMRREEG